MANLVPLTRFRRNDSKPLHSRWGDVSITTPTEGSWCQYNNSHHSAQRWREYGPGYVPEGAPRVLSRPRMRKDGGNHNGYNGDGVEGESAPSSSSSSSSLSSRSGSPFSSGKGMGALNPRRLSMRLGRTKDVDGEQGQQQSMNTKPEFAYKPVRQDYSTEVNHRASGFRYIPASPEYVDEAEMIKLSSLTPRLDQPLYIPGDSSDGLDNYGEEEVVMQGRRGSALLPRRALLGTSRQYQQQQQKNVAPIEKKKRHSRRRLTTVMVPGVEDMYG